MPELRRPRSLLERSSALLAIDGRKSSAESAPPKVNY